MRLAHREPRKVLRRADRPSISQTSAVFWLELVRISGVIQVTPTSAGSRPTSAQWRRSTSILRVSVATSP